MPDIEQMPFDAAWLVGHSCSSMTSQDGETYIVRSPDESYAHAHPYIASCLCHKTPRSATEGSALVLEALTRGYLRVAVLPAIVGITVDVEGVEIHAERILSIADLVGARVLRVEVVDGVRATRKSVMNVVWRWESDGKTSPRLFEIAFKEMLHAPSKLS